MNGIDILPKGVNNEQRPKDMELSERQRIK